VLSRSEDFEGSVISMNSGLLAGAKPDDPWQLLYTTGTLGPSGEHLSVCRASSRDQGRTWRKSGIVLPTNGSDDSVYHASIHREGEAVRVFAWLRNQSHNGLYRFTWRDDGKSLSLDPDRPLMASPYAPAAEREAAGEGRTCNDAFDVLHNSDGSFQLFAAGLAPATDPRAVVKHDNAPGMVRRIVHATSPDGLRWSATSLIIAPEYDQPAGDPFDTQFYGLQVFLHRGFYLGLLHVFHVESQTIQPEWAWSHDGVSWTRTRAAAIPLGDEGTFDSRMIVFGRIAMSEDEVIWLYSGYNWRHNAFRRGEDSSAIGRAVLPKAALDAWLDTLPQP
jgi:hypothetical protein